jgi:hypothetical protein
MRKAVMFTLALGAMAACAMPARAQVQVGPQLSLGTDAGLGLGARLVFPLRTGALGIRGSLDGNYFTGGGTEVDGWIDTNANVSLPIPIAQDFDLRLGAGLNVTHLSYEGGGATSRSETKAGLNLLGAIEFPKGIMTPFGELRVVATGPAQQLIFSAGVTFGGRSQ